MKVVTVLWIIVVLAVECRCLELGRPSKQQQLDNNELQETRQVAVEFTKGFLQKTDLTLLVKDIFFSDFIERYKSEKSKDRALNSSVDLYFVPGLDYNAKLLAEVGPEDWLRFYTAANNFLFFGVVSAIKKSGDVANIKATEMFPPSVVSLLNTNETLANMIVRKGKSRAVSSVAEMRRAAAILEQAVSIMRQQLKGQSPLQINEREMIKAMEEDEYFKPIIETVDTKFFGLPKGERVIFINTPILFRLTLAKDHNNKFKILWAEPYTEG